jgi:hypothetical protein
MPLKAYWSYEFSCDKPLERMLALLNEAGPWTWELRESHWYGDYLNTRPLEGVRVRIHEFQPKCSGLLQIESDSPAERDEIDKAFRALLMKLGAQGVEEQEPYD